MNCHVLALVYIVKFPFFIPVSLSDLKPNLSLSQLLSQLFSQLLSQFFSQLPSQLFSQSLRHLSRLLDHLLNLRNIRFMPSLPWQQQQVG